MSKQKEKKFKKIKEYKNNTNPDLHLIITFIVMIYFIAKGIIFCIVPINNFINSTSYNVSFICDIIFIVILWVVAFRLSYTKVVYWREVKEK